jgi:hypothetical protein
METLAFVQGILTVIAFVVIFGIFWAVNKIIDMKHQLETLERHADETETRFHFRVDRELEEVNKLIEQMYRDMDEKERDMLSLIDSRFNKFEAKIRSDRQLLRG